MGYAGRRAGAAGTIEREIPNMMDQQTAAPRGEKGGSSRCRTWATMAGYTYGETRALRDDRVSQHSLWHRLTDVFAVAIALPFAQQTSDIPRPRLPSQ